MKKNYYVKEVSNYKEMDDFICLTNVIYEDDKCYIPDMDVVNKGNASRCEGESVCPDINVRIGGLGLSSRCVKGKNKEAAIVVDEITTKSPKSVNGGG